MTVKGRVTMSLTLNVYELETDSVSIDKHGNVKILDDEKFFEDWCNHWEHGIGELLRTSIEYEELEKDKEDE